jgi:hypothetical protein
MSENGAYLSSRAVEAERLAASAKDERVRSTHIKFAEAYRDRLNKDGSPETLAVD